MRVDSPTRAVPLIADDRDFGKLKILPLFAWGLGAAIALGFAVVAARTEVGAQRAHAVLVNMLSPPASADQRAEQQLSGQMVAWSQGVEKQFRRQSDIIQSLTEQRDTLSDKVTAMERHLNDLTVALGRTTARMETETRLAQSATAAAAVAASVTKGAAPSQKVDMPEIALPSMAAPSLRGQITAPQTQPANPNALPPGQIYPPASATIQNAPDVAAGPASTGSLPAPTSLAPEAPALAPAPMTRPFPVAAPRAAAEAAAAARQAAARPAQNRAVLPMFQSNPLMTTGILDTPLDPGAVSAEFAVDLGVGTTIDALRARWNEIRATQSPLFDNLKPLVALKEGGKSGQELHLVAGPLGSAAATARVCAVLSGTGVHCQSTFYEGQHLALR